MACFDGTNGVKVMDSATDKFAPFGLTCPLLPPQLCVCFFFMTTPITGFRGHTKSVLSHLETRLITSAKTLFPNKVTF